MSVIPVHRYPPAYGAHPRLRRVDVQEVRQQGRSQFQLRHPTNLTAEPITLTPEALAIASFFDGQRDIRDVQLAVYKQYGQLIHVERVHQLALALWKTGYLEADHGHEAVPAAELVDEDEGPSEASETTDPTRHATELAAFRALAARKSSLAGQGYDADPDRLAEQLDAWFLHPDGPGGRPHARTGTALQGLLVPQRDLDHAGPVYAHAYRALAEGSDADLFILLGHARATPAAMFTATTLDYETPLGRVPTDREALAKLQAGYGERLFTDELVHREEGALELQVLWLRHLHPDRAITVVPILCSSLYGCAAQGARPEALPEVQAFTDALLQAIEGRKACIIAAGDLSHVGVGFGDPGPPDASILQSLAQADRASLDRALALDADGFFDDVGRDADTRRIAALTPTYMLLKLLRARGVPVTGRLLAYQQWWGEAEQSAVSYAAAAFERT